jgi:hypothetical protein
MGLHGVRVPPNIEFTFAYPDYLSPQVVSAVEVITIVIASALSREQVSITTVEVCPQGDQLIEVRFARSPGDYAQIYSFTNPALYQALEHGKEILDANGDEDGLSLWAAEETKKIFEPYRIF